MAVVFCHGTSHLIEVQPRIKLAQQMIDRHMAFKSELIKQLFRRLLMSHNLPNFSRCS